MRLPVLSPDTAVARAAESGRQSWGLDADSPIEYLTHEIERGGVAIVVRRMLTSSRRILGDEDSTGKLDKHLGYSVRVGEFNTRPLIIVRQSNSWERTRWTLAHEVGHLTLHASGSVTAARGKQASAFASELLAPAGVLADEVSRAPSLAELLPIGPAAEYLRFLRDGGASPHTVRADAAGIAEWFTVLEHTGHAWDNFPTNLFGQLLRYLRTGDLPGTSRIGAPQQRLAASSLQPRAAAV